MAIRYYYKDEKGNLYNYKTPRENLIAITEEEFMSKRCTFVLPTETQVLRDKLIKVDLHEREALLRKRRQEICFTVINRGKLWYDKLSKEQLEELDKWYDDWLNVTITMQVPETPDWINNKIENNMEVL